MRGCAHVFERWIPRVTSVTILRPTRDYDVTGRPLHSSRVFVITVSTLRFLLPGKDANE
jgi:hypothetical protein